jgi:hypothetical protein
VCGGSQPGRLRASAGRNPPGRPEKPRQRGKRSPKKIFGFSLMGKVWGGKKRFPKSPLRAPPQVCGGSQPGRLRASAGRNPSGRPRPGQGGSEGKGRAKVKGRRGRDRKQKRKDRGEQGQHVKSYGRPCMGFVFIIFAHGKGLGWKKNVWESRAKAQGKAKARPRPGPCPGS